MTPVFPIPLPLADSDGIVKIVLFGLAALVWVVAQVGSAAKSQAKKRQQFKLSDSAPDPSSPQQPRGRQPAMTRLERQLAERKREAIQFRQDRPAPPPPVVVAPTQSYEQLRQSRQAPAKRPAPNRPKNKPAFKPVPPPPVVAKSRPATPSEGPVTKVAKRFRADIGSTEIGSAKPDRRTAGQRRTGLRALLAPNALRDTLAAVEILKPPLALRGTDDDRSR